MAPFPSPSRRLSLLACLALGGGVLLLPGCGSDSAATADSAPATTRATAAAGAKARTPAGCPGQVDTFVDSLGSLRRQLATGLSFEQYAAKVKGLRRSYDRLPIGRLAIECLAPTGTPAEAAFNKYIDAANAWGECLADASCTTTAIEPVLQRKWRAASHSLDEAQ